MRARHALPLLLLVASVAVGALACSDTRIPTSQPVPPPPPPPPASFGLRPALDTAAVGDSVTFLAQRADSTVDDWIVSDSGLARVVARERGRAIIVTRAIGTVTVTARRQSDSGQATLVIRQQGSFVLAPGLDTLPLGSGVRLDAVGASVDQWVISDTSLARLGPHYDSYAHVVTHAPGTVTVIARRGADSAVATLVIFEPAPPAGWDVINLGVLDAVFGRPVAINDSGTIVGVLYSNPDPDHTWNPAYGDPGWQGFFWLYEEQRGFVYSHGMMRQLSGRDTLPQAIGPSDVIGGVTKVANVTGQFLVWDSPDAPPRALPNGTYFEPWGGRIIGVNARGDILASIGEGGSGILYGPVPNGTPMAQRLSGGFGTTQPIPSDENAPDGVEYSRPDRWCQSGLRNPRLAR